MSKRILAYIMNVLVAALCAVAVYAYATKPLLVIKGTVTLNADTVSEMIGSNIEGSSLSVIDFNEVLGDDYSIEISLAIESKALFNSFKTDKTGVKKYLEDEIINPNASKIISSLTDNISKLMGKLVKQAAKATIVTMLDLGDKGLSDADQQKINTAIDNIFAKFDEKAKVEDFTDTVINEISNLSGVNGLEIEGLEDIGEEEKQQLRDELTGMFDGLGLVDEEGNICDTDAAIAALMEQFLGSDSPLGGDETPDTGDGEQNKGGETPEASNGAGLFANDNVKIKVVPFGADVAYADGEEDDAAAKATAEIQKKITDTLMSKLQLSDQVSMIVLWVFRAFAIFLVVLMATWGWLVLKIIIRIFRRNPTIKLWVPIWFGWTPATLSFVVNYGFDAVMSKFGSELGQFAGMFKISLETSAKTAFFCAVGLFVLWFPYAVLRKSLRKDVKEYKKRKRLEKQAKE